jgi:hypothetical protein
MADFEPSPTDYWADAVAQIAHDRIAPEAIIIALSLSEHEHDMAEAFNAAIWAAVKLQDIQAGR